MLKKPKLYKQKVRNKIFVNETGVKILSTLLNLDIRRWQSYVEPGDEAEVSSPTKRISRNLDHINQMDEELLPLPENTLVRNLGLELIVVVTKVCVKF